MVPSEGPWMCLPCRGALSEPYSFSVIDVGSQIAAKFVGQDDNFFFFVGKTTKRGLEL